MGGWAGGVGRNLPHGETMTVSHISKFKYTVNKRAQHASPAPPSASASAALWARLCTWPRLYGYGRAVSVNVTLPPGRARGRKWPPKHPSCWRQTNVCALVLQAMWRRHSLLAAVLVDSRSRGQLRLASVSGLTGISVVQRQIYSCGRTVVVGADRNCLQAKCT
eukprot:scaffold350_cov117-Isochrysis_galbana.AAC.1